MKVALNTTTLFFFFIVFVCLFVCFFCFFFTSVDFQDLVFSTTTWPNLTKLRCYILWMLLFQNYFRWLCVISIMATMAFYWLKNWNFWQYYYITFLPFNLAKILSHLNWCHSTIISLNYDLNCAFIGFWVLSQALFLHPLDILKTTLNDQK